MKRKKSSTARRKTFFNLGKYLIVSWGITLLIGAAKIYIEHQPAGHQAELIAYEFLQRWIPPYEHKDALLPVAVLDISKISGGKSGEITPREALLEITENVIKQRPLAVAIDIDFSPNEEGWVTDEDPKFFDYCLEVKKKLGIPIFLGVYEAQTVRPEAWLGVEKYKTLAVALTVPEVDTRRIPLRLQVDNSSEPLPTLSAALAQASGKEIQPLPKWLSWAVEVTKDQRAGREHATNDGYTYADILVNYSKLDSIRHNTVYYSPPNLSKPDELSDRLVIIGDADEEEAMDTFPVPGYGGDIPGVYLHASAVYTLVTQPLYELTGIVRFGLDFIISGALIFSIAFIRFRHRYESEFPWQKQQTRFIWLAVFIVLAAGILLIRLLSIFWLDFLLIIAALLLHPKVENKWHAFTVRFSKA